MDVQLTYSRDLNTWKRLGDRKPFIGCSRLGSGAYDLACIIGPSNTVVRGDELWFYYTGGMIYGLVTKRGTDAYAICLAVLRHDGFISLDADKSRGTVVTKPFTLKGKGLFVNADADEGELQVEVVDGDGRVLAVSVPLTSDLRRGRVTWEKGRFADLVGKVVSLRFKLRNGSLYSYWVQ